MASKVEPFNVPRAKVETKPRTMINDDFVLDCVMDLDQKFC